MTQLTFDLEKSEEKAIHKLIQKLRSRSLKLFGVILYGSRARGEGEVDSDIDLLLILGSEDWDTRNLVSQIASRVSLESNVLISPHVISLTRWREMERAPFTFFRNVFREGVPIVGEENLFRSMQHQIQ